jgi:hypothetical protein
LPSECSAAVILTFMKWRAALDNCTLFNASWRVCMCVCLCLCFMCLCVCVCERERDTTPSFYFRSLSEAIYGHTLYKHR